MGIATIVLFFVSTTIALVMPCGATLYLVGNTAGWDASTDLKTWLEGKSFMVNDTLVFVYSSSHSVMVVSKSDYDSCGTSDALQSFSNLYTQITLSKPGNMYFICGTPGHCDGGMKMAINVQGAGAAANGGSPAPSPAPSPASAPSSPPVASPDSAPSSSPADAATSPSTPVSTTPSTSATPATSISNPPAATQSPVVNNAATSISHGQATSWSLVGCKEFVITDPKCRWTRIVFGGRYAAAT